MFEKSEVLATFKKPFVKPYGVQGLASMYSREGEEAILNWVKSLTGQNTASLAQLANCQTIGNILNG